MWFKNILRPKPAAPALRRAAAAETRQPLFDERFLRSLDQLELIARRSLLGNPASGQHHSRRLMPTTTFSDHRPYTPGDDLRYIDWNAYARQEQMLLKQGESEQDIHVHLIIDSSPSMAWGDQAKTRYARRLAAALGYLALSASDRLHVHPLDPTLARSLGPIQGKRHLIPLLKYLDQLPDRGASNLVATTQRLARQHQRGGILIICSDLLTEIGLAEALQALPLPRWQILVLHLSDPRENLAPAEGPIELVDSETGQTLELVLDQATVAEYQSRLQLWREQIAKTAQRRGAIYAPVQTDWSLDRAVIPYLRARFVLR